MQLEVQSLDGDTFYVNPDLYAMIKYHPSSRLRECGVLIMPCGREVFITVASMVFITKSIYRMQSNSPNPQRDESIVTS
jgi:hypothetical protein